jgi:hypothetical protein
VTFFIIFLSGVRLSPLGTAATNWPIVPVPDDGDCGAVGGMKIGRGNRSTRRKPAPPQIPHDQTRARTRAAAVGSQVTKLLAGRSRFDLLHRSCRHTGPVYA